VTPCSLRGTNILDETAPLHFQKQIPNLYTAPVLVFLLYISYHLFPSGFLMYTDDGGIRFVQSICTYLPSQKMVSMYSQHLCSTESIPCPSHIRFNITLPYKVWLPKWAHSCVPNFRLKCSMLLTSPMTCVPHAIYLFTW